MLVEVLLSMTILAIAGTMVMRSFQNAIEYTKNVRDLSKVVFLTQSKLHEIEMLYDRKPVQDVNLGFMEGRFVQPGSEEYVWRAQVDIDDDGVMYLISVWVQHEDDVRSTRRVRRSRRSDMYGFMLKTMVPAARINEMLIMGEHIGARAKPPGRGSRGGERGSRMNRGGGGRR